MKTKKRKSKDRMDALLDNLDRYYFRMNAADLVLGSSEYIRSTDFVDDVRVLFETPTEIKAKSLFYENLEEVKDTELFRALEEAAVNWQSEAESFAILLGFVLGLRMAGIDSERTKQMARTWRLGNPRDD